MKKYKEEHEEVPFVWKVFPQMFTEQPPLEMIGSPNCHKTFIGFLVYSSLGCMNSGSELSLNSAKALLIQGYKSNPKQGWDGGNPSTLPPKNIRFSPNLLAI